MFSRLLLSSRLRFPAPVSPLVSRNYSVDIKWDQLGFSYYPSDCHLKMVWKDGAWGKPEFVKEPYVNVHIAATALHYGQSIFEGLKAFRTKSGKVALFRADENGRRLNNSAARVMMPQIEIDTFVDACAQVVNKNIDYVPPYGSGGSVYLRPVCFGSGPQLGVNPATEYTLIIFATPVGNYYKGGIVPVPCLLMDDWDRAAPLGTGQAKLAGNYCGTLLPHHQAKEKGFPIILYLDAREHKYIEEFNTSNFVAFHKNGSYVTPKSPSILKSVTNKCMMELAKANGKKVEVRDVSVDELDQFEEVAACGTAVVVTPIREIVGRNVHVKYKAQTSIGPEFQKMYQQIREIQNGEVEDKFGWLHYL